jgi:putative salt-induced outer membrane protein YdiY
MMLKYFCCLLLLLVSIFDPLCVFADQITLKNGDRLTGKIVSRDADVITLETDYAGVIKISAARVDKVISGSDVPATAKADSANQTPRSVPADADKTRSVKAPPSTIKPVPKLFGGEKFFGLTNGWDGNANIGFSYTSGNTRTSTMTTGIRAVKIGFNDNLTVYVRSLWNNNRNNAGNKTTSNAVWGGLRYDRNINERLFGFVAYDFESDRPKKLNYRTVVGGGVGHHTVKNEDTEWDILLGGAWNHAWQVGTNSDTPEATFGSSLKHKFNDRLKLQKTFSFYQDVTRAHKYRFIFDSTFSADVTKRVGWFISLGDRYNNEPIGDSRKNDILFTTGIKWNFGRKK